MLSKHMAENSFEKGSLVPLLSAVHVNPILTDFLILGIMISVYMIQIIYLSLLNLDVYTCSPPVYLWFLSGLIFSVLHL